jgi:hypothetical protein
MYDSRNNTGMVKSGSPQKNKSRWISRECSTHGDEKCIQMLVKRPLGRPNCRWEDKIKMGLKEIGCEEIN